MTSPVWRCTNRLNWERVPITSGGNPSGGSHEQVARSLRNPRGKLAVGNETPGGADICLVTDAVRGKNWLYTAGEVWAWKVR